MRDPPTQERPGPMEKSTRGSWTVGITLGLALLYGLQVIPTVGLAVMFFGMALAGPYIWGFLPHLITIGLICDVSRKRFSRNVLVIPILAYSAYYAFFA